MKSWYNGHGLWNTHFDFEIIISFSFLSEKCQNFKKKDLFFIADSQQCYFLFFWVLDSSFSEFSRFVIQCFFPFFSDLFSWLILFLFRSLIVETGIYTRDLRQTTSTVSRNGPTGEDEDGPDLVAPSLKEMFTAAMVMQSTSVAGTDEKKSSKKGKKGKGGKGTLLFATGAQRKY